MDIGEKKRAKKHTKKQFQAIELFAGAGGMALGVHEAGFHHLALVEWDKHAVETLRKNSRDVLGLNPELVMNSDVRKIDLSAYRGKLDLLAGGPPCQPFSTGGRNHGFNDKRDMFPAMLEVVQDTMPRAVLIENVRGLKREKFETYFDYILVRLKYPLLCQTDGESWQDHYTRLKAVNDRDFNDDEQYLVDHQLIDTADFGVPQRRMRIIISAFRRDLGIEPIILKPTHSREALLISQWVTKTYWEKNSIEPYDDYLTKTDQGLVKRLKKDPELIPSDKKPWVTVREAIGDLPPPVARGKTEEIANHIQHPGARIYNGHIGSFWDYPSKALKAGTHGTPGGENILREKSDGSEVRYYTTREAARLHTFPDTWQFLGTWGACIKQLGNALPVEVATNYATEIRERLEKSVNPVEVNENGAVEQRDEKSE